MPRPNPELEFEDDDVEFDDDDGNVDTIAATKMEVFAFEYEHLLAAQLESQRQYYEEQLREERRAQEAIRAERAEQQEIFDRERARLVGDNETLRASLRDSEVAVKDLGKKVKAMSVANKEVETLKLLNDTLIANQRELRERHEKECAEREVDAQTKARVIDDLQAQVGDLMMFLDAKEKIAGGEMEGGSLEVSQPPQQQQPGANRRGRRRR